MPARFIDRRASWETLLFITGIGSGSLLLFFHFKGGIDGQTMPVVLASEIGGIVATAALHFQLVRLWPGRLSGGTRALLCCLASLAVMNVVIIASFLATGDLFFEQRVAEKGLAFWFLEDVVLRSVIFGTFFGGIALVWLWVPLGLLWYSALCDAERSSVTPPPSGLR